MIGFSFGASGRAGSAAFDPSTLALTGWWRSNYSVGSWTGRASAGISGTKDLTNGTGATQPDAVIVGAHTVPDFEASNTDQLTQAVGDLNDFFNAGAGSVVVLLAAESWVAAQANAYAETCIWNDAGGNVGLYVSSSGARAALYDGAWNFTPYATGLSLSTDGALQMYWDGSTLGLRANSGTWQTTPAGSISNMGFGLRLGQNANAANHGDGIIKEMMTIDAAWSAGTFDNIKSYINTLYSLSL